MAPRTKQEAPVADVTEELPAPGTNVVARAKGYPPWPAMVLSEADVPTDVLAKKPSKKVSLPVLFYNDMSYLWVLPTEVQILSHEQALKSSNGKIKRALKEAYAMVAESPEDYENKLAKMLPERAPISEETDEVVVKESKEDSDSETKMDVDEPPVSSSRARSAADQAAEQLAKTRPARARKRTAEPPVVETTKKPRKASAKPLRDVAEDEDESEYVDQSESASDAYSAQTLSDSLAARVELCQQVRTIIQDNLLVKPIKSISEVEAALNRIEEAPAIEIAAVRRSKLHRVIVAALMQELPENIVTRLNTLTSQWTTHSEPVIKGIPEHLAPKEESELPESRDSTPRPADTREPSVEPVAESVAENGTATENGAAAEKTAAVAIPENVQISESSAENNASAVNIPAAEIPTGPASEAPTESATPNKSSTQVKMENENKADEPPADLSKPETNSGENKTEIADPTESHNLPADPLEQ